MWHIFQKAAEQVNTYGSGFGKLWYLTGFVLRLIVVTTIGIPVYHDEQSSFKCSTKQEGCSNVCFNQFSKISPIRFWSFQVMTVALPMALFHAYATMAAESCDATVSRRRKSGCRTGIVKMAYYWSVILRFLIEVTFIYLAYHLYIWDMRNNRQQQGELSLQVPSKYLCLAFEFDVEDACSQHFYDGEGFVPCWVSRPWEKTILFNYMNIISLLSCVLCLVEWVYLTPKTLCKSERERKTRNHERTAGDLPEKQSLTFHDNRSTAETNLHPGKHGDGQV